MDLSVCLLTYRRPEMLENLLTSILAQEWSPSPKQMEIVILDTDPEASARDVVNDLRPLFQCSIIHETSPHRLSIPEGRNRSIALSRLDPILLVDDDQELPPNALGLLADRWERQPDTVGGLRLDRVFRFSGDPTWIHRCKVFNPRRAGDDEPIPGSHLGTGGILVRRRVFEHFRQPFDPYWGSMGGEDNAFFAAAEDKGETFRNCRSIHIIEHVPQARTTIAFVLCTSYRKGLIYALLITRGKGTLRIALFYIKAIFALIASILLVLISIPLGRVRLFNQLCLAFRQFGKLSAPFGEIYGTYRRNREASPSSK